MPTLKSSSKNIGITIGDPGGIGPEVTTKALGQIAREFPHYQFTIIGDTKVVRYYRQRFPSNCRLHDVACLSKKKWMRGRIHSNNGQAALSYLQTAIQLIDTGELNALVTAPVSKEAIVPFDPKFVGHTELLAKASGCSNVGMMFVAQKMRTIIATRHLPLKKVPGKITKDLVTQTINLTNTGLREQFKIRRPRIAVCGLNPHAGENGLLGTEENKYIIPAIKSAQRRKINVSGPFPADTIFIADKAKDFDCIIAMYHDQGLIPIKTLYFDKLVNFTIGLPYVRTSPAHGTAFDIAGKNKANPSSMLEAMRLAAKLCS